jgi:2-phospho-L-lactate/phosphoenolpyruvate guanylyltransferase
VALLAQAPGRFEEIRSGELGERECVVGREHAVSIRASGRVTAMATHVLVPVKRLDGAKTRLSAALAPEERAELMRTMLSAVLEAVQVAAVGPVTIVSSEALAVDGIPRFDDRGLPWNEALAAAMREVVSEECVAVVSADLPRLRAEEVAQLVAAAPERGLAIARAQDGGTNAVAMRPPGVVTTHFGESASCSVHVRVAEDAGLEAVVVDLPGLAFDLDTPEDLARSRNGR